MTEANRTHTAPSSTYLDKDSNDSLEALLGPDAPVAPWDRGAGTLRGAGARSPLFWKSLLVAMALIWGFSFFIMKGALDLFPPFLIVGARFLPSAGLLFLFLHRRIRAHFNARNLVVGLGMGLIMWAAYGLQTAGLVGTTSGKSAFLTGTYCILVPFISHMMGGERLSRWNVGAALLCLCGVAFVALDDLSIGLGDALTLVGAGFFALQMAVMSCFGRDLDVNVLTFWMLLVVGVGALVTSFLFEPAPQPEVWTPDTIGILVFLSVVCTCIGLLIQNLAFAHVPASTGSLLLSLESPSGVLFAILFAGEMLTGRLVFGFVLIFLSIVLSETRFGFLADRTR
ncbi:DMT family transporter [Collinsella sp. AGMB00827]|uniref:DMT family transporter n=1 Tax=Collinsella ureilytica TaxID=2869515 RepID=A0ABS7MJB3_9ACTN|nr:DMT family transporter [Collinsella urealyticum]MBY4797456.1 DMT family transporter [Collinsella urealyticum]